MILIDTSVLIEAIRDRKGTVAKALLDFAGEQEIVISRFTELEFLMGARSEADWRRLVRYIADRTVLEPTRSTWSDAARIYFDLRRAGTTVRSSIDCCIAQIALERSLTIVHNDRDFEAIATVRPLQHHRLEPDRA
jgi:predicted nucleic acid-binding protein